MSIDKSINEIFFRLKEHKEVFIKLVAIGEFGLVFTAYGIVSDIDRNNIYFSYKRMAKGKNCLSEDSKNPQARLAIITHKRVKEIFPFMEAIEYKAMDN